MRNDEEWMRIYQEGDVEGFNFLYEKYSDMVYAFIKRRLRESEAEDFYQKVWRHLHEKRELYRDQPFAPWFFVMIRNLLIDEYRSLDRRSQRELSDELLNKIYATTDNEDELSSLLDKLPQETRELVEKYYLEGVSYEDLEKESGLSQINLRQRLSRALRGLRKHREE